MLYRPQTALEHFFLLLLWGVVAILEWKYFNSRFILKFTLFMFSIETHFCSKFLLKLTWFCSSFAMEIHVLLLKTVRHWDIWDRLWRPHRTECCVWWEPSSRYSRQDKWHCPTVKSKSVRSRSHCTFCRAVVRQCAIEYLGLYAKTGAVGMDVKTAIWFCVGWRQAC